MTASPAFALVDWGTTSFRAWAVDAAGQVLGERRAADGLVAAGPKGFGRVLEEHLAALGVPAGTPALLCGMVGSRTGWVEASYLDAPVGLDDLAARATAIPHEPRPVFVLPGIAQRSDAEPDVMRGEETQLLGVVAEGFRTGLVCMPGTHSKWVRLDEGTVEGFSTFMTGELFQMLRSNSILSQAVATEAAISADDPAFASGVRHALDEPALLTSRLFQVRAGWLLHGAAPESGLARLSGALIGLEMAGALARHDAREAPVALLGSGPIVALYERALAVADLGSPRRLDADACVRHGLLAAARLLFASKDSGR
ncbi:2-dehydro-3-deoxygalactonokinase [Aureimonas sp. AU4]|uniref:2-dehydro-3-deoxygalactonokinase n=1 Tax=Aureimonas sp. AU4 TaxID=1638163 RepID=UPI0007860466|nr:2-dehydro-3-deoxygalactonokinase [Aureimonas sp. AU4]